MSNIPAGGFLTTIDGRRCTAVPRKPRSVAPEESSSSTTTTRAAVQTSQQPKPTQDNGGGNRNDNGGDNRGVPVEETSSSSIAAPAETTSAPAPDQDGNDGGASRESTAIANSSLPAETTTEQQIVPSMTSSSISTSSSVATRTEESETSRQGNGDPDESQGVNDPSTSSESSALPIVVAPEETKREDITSSEESTDRLQRPTKVDTTTAPSSGQALLSSSALLEVIESSTSSSVVVSTATLLAGLTSLTSPRTSSFFASSASSSSPPSSTEQSALNPISSSFTSLVQPSSAAPDIQAELESQISDSSNPSTDTTAFPDQIATSTTRSTVTTIGLVSNSGREQDRVSATTSSIPDGEDVPQQFSDKDDSGPNAALIGGIVGAAVGLVLTALLIWFCLKRRAKKRKGAAFSPGFSTRMMRPGAEKRKTYEFDSGSVGPTPRREKFAAAVGYHVKQFGGRFGLGNDSTHTVNMDRGNSQFLAGLPSHSRHPSSTSVDSAQNISARDRVSDWWSRLKEDVSFKWRIRTGQVDKWAVRNKMEKETGDFDPDFMALLSKDEKRAVRRSLHSRDQSITSLDRFLGDLRMDANNEKGPDLDPLRDCDIIVPPRAATARPTDPFTDAAAVQPSQVLPQTYVASVRRSRGASVSSGIRASNIPPTHRDSVQSQSSFETRRNRCRSDPFDLELDHRKLPSLGTTGPVPPVDSVHRPPPRPVSGRGHSKKASAGGSSRYTQASLGEWSDPGPDVGSAEAGKGTTGNWSSIPSAGKAVGRRSRGSDESLKGRGIYGIGEAV